MNNNKELQLTLTVNQLNVVLSALSDAPYRVSAPIIGIVEKQIKPQLEQQEQGDNQ